MKAAFIFFKYLDPFERSMRLTFFGAVCYFVWQLRNGLEEK